MLFLFLCGGFGGYYYYKNRKDPMAVDFASYKYGEVSINAGSVSGPNPTLKKGE